MSFWDRLMGREEEPAQRPQAQTVPARKPNDDEVAIERYRYLLKTAPAATIEQVHEEAFARLTPQQRAMVFQELGEYAAPGEAPISDDPRALARSATRSELRAPGTMERAFTAGAVPGAPAAGRQAAVGGPSFGSMLGSSLLGTVAGYVIGSALVSAFLPPIGYADTASADQQGTDQQGADQQADGSHGDPGSADSVTASGDPGSGTDGWGGDPGAGGDFGGGDLGGGDFGGGDFGGGDFGGGDFGF